MSGILIWIKANFALLCFLAAALQGAALGLYPSRAGTGHAGRAAAVGAQAVVFLHLLILAAAAFAGSVFPAETEITILCLGAVTAVLCVLDAVLNRHADSFLAAVIALGTIPLVSRICGGDYDLLRGICVIFYGVRALYILAEGAVHGKRAVTRNTIQEVLDAYPDGLLFTDKRGRILYANRPMYTFAEQLLGKKLTDGAQLWTAGKTRTAEDTKIGVKSDEKILVPLGENDAWELTRTELDGGKTVRILAENVTERMETIRQIQMGSEKLLSEGDEAEETRLHVKQLRREHTTAATKRVKYGELYEKVRTVCGLLTGKRGELYRASVLVRELCAKETQTGNEQLDALRTALGWCGIDLETEGEFPQNEGQIQVLADFLERVSIRAAKCSAAKIRAVLTTEGNKLVLTVTQDGETDKSAPRNVGGLFGMRRKSAQAGGVVTAYAVDEHTTRMEIPAAHSKI